MSSRPAHLGAEYAGQFQDGAVAAVYHHRPPYAAALFPMLRDMLSGTGGRVLDAGCGTGDIARRLAGLAGTVDALDVSAAMIARGRSLPGGDAPNLNWTIGSMESTPLEGGYGLIVAGEALHWMDWDLVLPRFASLLMPGGMVAIVVRHELPSPWSDDLRDLIVRFSTNLEFARFELVPELQRRALFEPVGDCSLLPEDVHQTVEGYVESIHSRNGFSRDRMDAGAAASFDAGVTELLQPWAPGGRVSFRVATGLTWGQPVSPRR